MVNRVSLIEALESRIAPAIFIVSTTNDSGPGSLRQAILDANAAAGTDSIDFQIPGDGEKTISVLSELPAIIEALEINVTFQKAIVLDGTFAGANADGFTFLNHSGSILSAFKVSNFPGNGIVVIGGGISIGSSVTNNGIHGIYLEDSNSYIRSCQIIGNGTSGITIQGGGGNTVLLSTIDGNGRSPAADLDSGGVIIHDSPDNRIGDYHIVMNPGPNSLSGNSLGILISGAMSSGNIIRYNDISSSVGDGVRVTNGAHDNEVGQVTSHAGFPHPEGNTIQNNGGWGIRFESAGENNAVVDNDVYSNGLGGVLISSTNRVTVGNSLWNIPLYSTADNVFNNNQGPAISVVNGQGNRSIHNSFGGNAGLPIDLGGDGSTPNDAGDRDTGANSLLNYPTFAWVNNELFGQLDTDRPNAGFGIEYYSINESGTTLQYLGGQSITTDANGAAIFKPNIASTGNIVAKVVHGASGDTSEFSASFVGPSLLNISDATMVEESNGSIRAVFTVTLNRANNSPVTVNFATQDGTAMVGTDFANSSGTLTFEPGVTSQTISVPIVVNASDEGDEQFSVILSSPTGAVIADGNANATIKANRLRISDATIIEDSQYPGGKVVTFQISLNRANNSPVTVQFATQDDTAIAGADYTHASGTVTFDPGVTSFNIYIPILDDLLVEADEQFLVNLSSSAGAFIADGKGICTIVSQDEPQNLLTISDAAITESPEGATAVFTVTLERINDAPVIVHFGTQDGTAAAGSDYFNTTGILTFDPGMTSLSISVPVLDDTRAEGQEQFSVVLSSPNGAAIADAQGVGTIDDDVILNQNFKISHNRKVATWTDLDGDVVTLRIGKSILRVESFTFRASESGLQLDKLDISKETLSGRGNLGSLRISVERGEGDGLVEVGFIDATLQSLQSISIAGSLAHLSVGNKPTREGYALKKLEVESLGGVESDSTEPTILSLGSIEQIIVHGDFADASVVTSPRAKLGRLSIGGDMIKTSDDPFVGVSANRIGEIVIAGDLIGLADDPIVISANGFSPKQNFSMTVLESVYVGGAVENATILGGGSDVGDAHYAKSGKKIGRIEVAGDWIASSVACGISPGADGFFGSDDDYPNSYPEKHRFSKIAEIVIHGSTQNPLAGTAAEGDSFAFTANIIGKLQIGGQPVSLDRNSFDDMILVETGDVRIRELP